MDIPKHIIQRSDYIDRIRPFMNTPVIKALTGQRRVGKSYMLMQLMQEIKKQTPSSHIIYLNFEDLAYDFIKTAKELHDFIVNQSVKNTRNYIFIDEVQEIKEFEKTLRSLVLNEDYDIYITGSNAFMFSGELATVLSGRYIEFRIYSLSYNEFLKFHTLPNLKESYDLYRRFGGLPYLVNLKLKEPLMEEYLKNIYTTIIFKDVVRRYKLRDSAFLERLTLFLADNIGNLFSAQKISNYLKSQHTSVSVKQVQNYINHLLSAFLIQRVMRYDLVGKRYFEFGEKYYFEDLGIRNALIGYRMDDRGKLLENIVYNHLLFRGYSVKIGNIKTEEIDFVCEKNNEKLYVQVALRIDNEETMRREVDNLLQIEDNYPKILVTEDDFQGNTDKGIKHTYILDFLTSY